MRKFVLLHVHVMGDALERAAAICAKASSWTQRVLRQSALEKDIVAKIGKETDTQYGKVVFVRCR